jgi:peptide deformylase
MENQNNNSVPVDANVDPITITPINPYADRIFIPNAEYPGKKRTVLIYPNEKLRQISTHQEFLGEGLVRLAADMVATAIAARAAGLSAIQIGAATRVCVISMGLDQFVVMVDPLIAVSPENGYSSGPITEGCLSFSGTSEQVERYDDIHVSYLDLQGRSRDMYLKVGDPATGLMAQTIQHEIEHLDGKLLIDNLDIIHKDRLRMDMKQIARKVKKLQAMTGGKTDPMQILFGYTPD